MPYIVNGVVMARAESLEGIEGTLEAFLSCLIVVRGCIGQISIFLNAF
jgi:hypothetical protein